MTVISRTFLAPFLPQSFSSSSFSFSSSSPSVSVSIAFRCFITLILYIRMLIADFRVLCTGVMVVAVVMTVVAVMRAINNKSERVPVIIR